MRHGFDNEYAFGEVCIGMNTYSQARSLTGGCLDTPNGCHKLELRAESILLAIQKGSSTLLEYNRVLFLALRLFHATSCPVRSPHKAILMNTGISTYVVFVLNLPVSSSPNSVAFARHEHVP